MLRQMRLLAGGAMLAGSLIVSHDAAAETAPLAANKPVAAIKGAAPQIDDAVLAAFKPGLQDAIPAEDNALTKEKIDLGRMLYYETRISKNQKISCNTCHLLDKYGVDGTPTSTGHKNQKGGRNAPTVYNAAGHVAQFWDGRAPTVEEQAKGPVLNPIEMAMASKEEVIAVLGSMPGYVDAFNKAFPNEKEPLSYDNFGKAVGAFERKLVTPSRFDKFIHGDKTALNAEEIKGLQTFVTTGCIACHSGPYVGGKMFQKVGLVKPWPGVKDLGRYEVSKGEGDRHVFKVPSLRNITKTAPYLHDGSVDKLEDQVRLMARHQLAKELGDDDVKSILAFLGALTGELPADYIKPPKLPESGAKTPAPAE